MVMNDRPLKKAKKLVTDDLYDITTFPECVDLNFGDGSFRSNVQSFLKKHAHESFTPSLFPSLISWQILFGLGDLIGESSSSIVALYVVEEEVTRSRSLYCDQCRVVGWSNHPVCSKRYHFIIRAASDPLDACQKACTRCGNFLHLLDSRCKSCGSGITSDDLEDWLYLQLEDTTHLLHGVIHSNGYGHLLRVNGREGGSKVLSGCDIMNFWDRLCITLAVRKVSVMDVSKKYGMEYRLLHAIINGHSWYGKWGYEFGSGSYALTHNSYEKAVDTLSNLALTSFTSQGRKPRSHLQVVIAFYQSLSDSPLSTLKDLFLFLLRLIREIRAPLFSKIQSNACGEANQNVLCSWTRDDVERVQQGMMKVLLVTACNSNWVSRRSLKGALCKAASLELLEYCLKHLGGRMTRNGLIVQSRCNPASSAVEFRLEPQPSEYNGVGVNLSRPTEEHLIRDLKFLYGSIFCPQTTLNYKTQKMHQVVADAAAKLLDCKQFLKDYMPNKIGLKNPFVMRFWCYIELADGPKDDPVPPPELILLDHNATVSDLKLKVTRAYQEVYPFLKRFQAEELLDYGQVEDDMTLKVLVGLSGSVRVWGRCPGLQVMNRFRMERGTENWVVDCMCGAKDDDGERMLACDVCGVWLHTRCAGIGCFDSIPAKFVCRRCLNLQAKKLNKAVNLPIEEGKKISGSNCRDAVVATNGITLVSSMAPAFDMRQV